MVWGGGEGYELVGWMVCSHYAHTTHTTCSHYTHTHSICSHYTHTTHTTHTPHVLTVIAMAMLDSVTVSIGLLTNGVLGVIFLVSAEVRSCTSE